MDKARAAAERAVNSCYNASHNEEACLSCIEAALTAHAAEAVRAERAEREAPEQYWEVALHWRWAGRFDEVMRFTVPSLAEIDTQVRMCLERIADRYAFDCGRVTKPLNPAVYELVITPLRGRERRSIFDQYQPVLDAAVAAKEAALRGRGGEQV
jgi:hypothetical protein